MAEKAGYCKAWVRRESRSKPGKFYYFNTTTGKSTWDVPAEELTTSENAKSVGSSRKRSHNPDEELQLSKRANYSKCSEQLEHHSAKLENCSHKQAQNSGDLLREKASTHANCPKVNKVSYSKDGCTTDQQKKDGNGCSHHENKKIKRKKKKEQFKITLSDAITGLSTMKDLYLPSTSTFVSSVDVGIKKPLNNFSFRNPPSTSTFENDEICSSRNLAQGQSLELKSSSSKQTIPLDQQQQYKLIYSKDMAPSVRLIEENQQYITHNDNKITPVAASVGPASTRLNQLQSKLQAQRTQRLTERQSQSQQQLRKGTDLSLKGDVVPSVRLKEENHTTGLNDKTFSNAVGPASTRLKQLQSKLQAKQAEGLTERQCLSQQQLRQEAEHSNKGWMSELKKTHLVRECAPPVHCTIPTDPIVRGLTLPSVTPPAVPVESTLSTSSELNSFDDEAMEIEYTESNVLLNIEHIRRKRCETEPQADYNNILRSQSSLFSSFVMDVDITSACDGETVYLVLDTNILLSHFKFVQSLLDKFVGGQGPITLYLPWQVLQELDTLKSRGKDSIKMLARRAINYLHDKFKSRHPRVCGQRFSDVTADHSMSPDDSILHACLKLQECHSDVVLLSNDVNLCNKALVSKVKAFTRDQFENEFQISPLTSVNSSNAVKTNVIKSANTESVPGEDISTLAVSVTHDLKTVIKDYLSQIVSRGMEKEYGSLWKKRTILPPPWQADKVVQCLIHHWLPICDVFPPSQVRENGEKLQKFLKQCKEERLPLDEVQLAVHLTSEVCRAVSKTYEDVTSKIERKLEMLMKRLQQNDVPPTSEKKGQFLELKSTSTEEGHNLVLSCFQSVLETVSNFCHSLTVIDSHNGISPEKKNRATELFGAVQTLLLHMQMLLSKPASTICTHDADVCEILRLIGGTSNQLTENHLITFCRSADTRKMLENGVNQFAALAETLKLI